MFGFAQIGVSARFSARVVLPALALCLVAVSPAPKRAFASPSPILDHLYGVSYPNSRDGWVVGAFGTIFRTSDGGQSWKVQDSSTTRQLYDVDFVDEQNGWIVGLSGLVLRTANGGNTWERQESGTDKHLFAVDFVDTEHGVAVGDWGIIITTADGGRTWVSHELTTDVILNDVVLVSPSQGWIAGELGTILHTDDGGNTWTRQETGLDKTLFGVFFKDAERGWAVGIDALILRTVDGGRTWTAQNGSTEVRALEQVGFSQAYDFPSLYGVSVVGDLGVAAGEIGAVFLSADGGQTWTRRETIAGSKPGWFRALSLAPGGFGGIVGEDGRFVSIAEGKLQLPEGDDSAAEEVH